MKKSYMTQDDIYVAQAWKSLAKKLFPCQIVVTLVMVTLTYIARRFINHHYFDHVVTDAVAGNIPNVVIALVAFIFAGVFAVAVATNIAFRNAPIRTITLVLLTFLVPAVIGAFSSFCSHIYLRPADIVYDFIPAVLLIGVWWYTSNALDEASGSNFGQSKVAKRIRNRIEYACIGQFAIFMILMAYVIGI
ncbi:MAG: hypothetical protein WC693_03415 [Patescibacteria group bacterium]